MAIIGYDVTTLFVYGVATDRRTYLMTEDGGVTWSSISLVQMTKIKISGNFVPSQDVPWLHESEMPDNPPSFVMGSYGGEVLTQIDNCQLHIWSILIHCQWQRIGIEPI